MIKDFFKQKSVTRFRPYDVQDLLQPLICSPPQTAPEDQVRQNNNILLKVCGSGMKQDSLLE